jgi:murein DD-endopeptidase MepM/ murein hydrolase activator NlpD
MIRFQKVLMLSSLLLAACGTPRGPAPVEYRGEDALHPPTAEPAQDESIPDAAPVQPIESQSLAPLEPDAPAFERTLPDRPNVPVRQAASIPFNAQAAAAQNSAAGAGSALKGVTSIAKAGGKLGSNVFSGGGEQKPVEVVPAKTRPASIKVGKGDTLFAISEKYQIALKPLIAENNLKAPYNLKTGQTLKLPPPLHYRVRPGDTVMAISRRFSLDFRSLALINDMSPPFALKANELLILPALSRGADGAWQSASKSVKPAVRKKGAASKPTPARPKVQAPSKNSTFAWPIKGRVVSNFGVKDGGTRNDGINIAAPAGSAVRAAGSGTVVYAGAELKSFGNLILIRHSNGWVSAYAHNRKLLVKEGAKVKAGDSIAEVGATGSVATPQLHFETRRGRKPVNPLLHLPKSG